MPRPDYILKAKERGSTVSGNRVGAAWEGKRGMISITLDLGITLAWNHNLQLNLFPNEETQRADAD